MIRDVISNLGASVWPLIGLILFFFVFIAIVIYTYRGRRDRFERESRLPLDDGAMNPSAATHGSHRELNETRT